MSSFTLPLQYEKTDKFRSGRPIYRLTAPFDYMVGSVNNPLTFSISVPAGFETDLASIPWPLRLIFRPDGPWVKAAVVHDYLYKMKDFDQTHVVADSIFLEAMIVSKVFKPIAIAFFLAVWTFGRPTVTKDTPVDGSNETPASGKTKTR